MPNSRSELLALKLVIISCGFSAVGIFLGFSTGEGQGRIGYALFGAVALVIGAAASVYLILMIRKTP